MHLSAIDSRIYFYSCYRNILLSTERRNLSSYTKIFSSHVFFFFNHFFSFREHERRVFFLLYKSNYVMLNRMISWTTSHDAIDFLLFEPSWPYNGWLTAMRRVSFPDSMNNYFLPSLRACVRKSRPFCWLLLLLLLTITIRNDFDRYKLNHFVHPAVGARIWHSFLFRLLDLLPKLFLS